MNLRSPWLSICTLWEKFWSAGDRKRSLYIIYEHYGIFYVDKWHISRIFKATFPCKISIIFRYGAFRNTFLSRKSNFSCRILPIAHMNWKISVRPVYSDSWISFSDCYFQHHFEHYFSSDSSGRKLLWNMLPQIILWESYRGDSFINASGAACVSIRNTSIRQMHSVKSKNWDKYSIISGRFFRTEKLPTFHFTTRISDFSWRPDKMR